MTVLERDSLKRPIITKQKRRVKFRYTRTRRINRIWHHLRNKNMDENGKWWNFGLWSTDINNKQIGSRRIFFILMVQKRVRKRKKKQRGVYEWFFLIVNIFYISFQNRRRNSTMRHIICGRGVKSRRRFRVVWSMMKVLFFKLPFSMLPHTKRPARSCAAPTT